MLHEQLKHLIGGHTEVAYDPPSRAHARTHALAVPARSAERPRRSHEGTLRAATFRRETVALTSRESGSAGGLPLCTQLATGLRYTVVDVSYGNMLLEFSAMFATTHGLQPSQATQP